MTTRRSGAGRSASRSASTAKRAVALAVVAVALVVVAAVTLLLLVVLVMMPLLVSGHEVAPLGSPSGGHGTDFGTGLSAVGASGRLVKALEGSASSFVKRWLWVRFPPLAFCGSCATPCHMVTHSQSCSLQTFVAIFASRTWQAVDGLLTPCLCRNLSFEGFDSTGALGFSIIL